MSYSFIEKPLADHCRRFFRNFRPKNSEKCAISGLNCAKCLFVEIECQKLKLSFLSFLRAFYFFSEFQKVQFTNICNFIIVFEYQ